MCGGDGFFMFSDPSDPDYLSRRNARRRSDTRESLHASIAFRKTDGQLQRKTALQLEHADALSPNEKGTIYIGSQFLFRSKDHGQSWDRISPDLTTNNPQEQKQEESGGGVTVDNSAAEMHTTIYSISESPKQAGTIWVGTDDGNVQVTRDAGKNWSNVVKNAKGVPEHAWVSWVQAAANYDAGTAYASFDRHTFGDMTPYIYKTTDFGASWKALVTPQSNKGLRGYVHVIKEDIEKPNMLFAGTEFGLWVSIDSGSTWAQFKGNDFPAVAVRDFDFQKRDSSLVLATHGRGIWIVDDLTPLRALDSNVLNAEATFLPSKPIQQRISAGGSWSRRRRVVRGAQSARWRRHRLLPEVTPSVRQAHHRGDRRRWQGDRYDSRQRAARHQPRLLVDAQQTAARAAGGADRVQLHVGRADADRHVYRAHDQR